VVRSQAVFDRRNRRAEFTREAAAQRVVLCGLADDVPATVDPQQRRCPTRRTGGTEQPHPGPRWQSQHLDVGGRPAPQQALGCADERHRDRCDDLLGEVAGDVAQIGMEFGGRHPISITTRADQQNLRFG